MVCFRREWPLIGLLLAVTAVSVGVGLMMAWPTAVLVDCVLSPEPSGGWISKLLLTPLPHSIVGRVIGLTLVGMTLKMTQDGLTWVRSILNRRIEFGGLIRVRSLMFRHLQSLGPEFHKARPQGDAAYRITFDANGFKDVLNTLIATTISAVKLVVMLAIMSSRSLPLTAIALGIVPAFVVINRFSGPRFRKRSAESKQFDADYSTLLQRALSTIGVTQAFTRERREFGKFRAANRRCARGWMNVTVENEIYWFAVRSVFSIGNAMVFGIGGYLVYRDQFVLHRSAGVHVGDLLLFMSYLNDLWGPLQDLTNFTANIQPPMAAVDRVMSVLAEKPLVHHSRSSVRLPRRPRTLAFESVDFAYPDGRPALSGLSVEIRPGQMVAFVGRSGAGKSTILGMMNRVFDPTAGRVTLDGRDLKRMRLPDVRRHVAIVPQDGQLLAGTVFSNIAYGRTGAKMDDVCHAAELAGAHRFILDLPDGYHTPVTEAGQNLSGGQRQRLAIARALLCRSPVLVLDEPTSALDPHHTQQLLSTLDRLRGSRSVVLVTHHLQSVVDCDQIFVVEGGRIAERGTYGELVEAGGLFARMAGRDHSTRPNVRAA